MSVIRWNPLREFDELFAQAAQAQTNRLAGRQSARVGATFTPAADIAETDASYLIELELPGFAASDVAVSVHDGVLSVAGERQPDHVRGTATLHAIEDEAGPTAESPSTESSLGASSGQGSALDTRRMHRAERPFGKFERRFRLPKDADIDAVSATAKNGVLTLEVGRLAEATRRAIEVQVA